MTEPRRAIEPFGPLEPRAFVWCIAGPRVGETLKEIVSRKQSDIARFGWCLWAYGGTGTAHPQLQVRRLAAEHPQGGLLPLLIADTGIESALPRVEFSGFRIRPRGLVTDLPPGMSPVTGAPGAWAFHLTRLQLVEAAVDVAAYVAPFARRGGTRLAEYLRGAHGKACAVRKAGGGPGDFRAVHVSGELAEPYAVFLVGR